MRIPLASGLITLCMVCAVPATSAQAGFMKTAGDTDVFYYQKPIPPLIGEKVRMTFVFTKHDKNTQSAGLPVTLRLIDTAYGNEAGDRQMMAQDFTTDANGAFEFDTSFTKQNYFDVELDFADSKGKETLGGQLSYVVRRE